MTSFSILGSLSLRCGVTTFKAQYLGRRTRSLWQSSLRPDSCQLCLRLTSCRGISRIFLWRGVQFSRISFRHDFFWISFLIITVLVFKQNGHEIWHPNLPLPLNTYLTWFLHDLLRTSDPYFNKLTVLIQLICFMLIFLNSKTKKNRFMKFA